MDEAREIAKRYEGLYLKPYLCPARVATIGRGSIRTFDGSRVTLDHRPITVAEADSLFDRDFAESEMAVDKLAPNTSAGQRGAFADFVFNLGSGNFRASTLRRKHNAGEYAEAAEQFGKWVYGGGVKLPGLVLRRAAERALYERDDAVLDT